MAVFNAAKREIDIKIVYYGPALCGKTTNVQCVHKMLAPNQRGDIMSLATKDDRTLFFDFLPIELGDVKGFKTRFHVYTVPGQVYYALTRRAVLTGVDGVVFVADSQESKMDENIESLEDLNENLNYYKKDLSSIPFVMQYNKRDMDNILPVAELNQKLNPNNVPHFASSAVDGTGVIETLTACCKLVLKQMDSTGGGAKKRRRQRQEETAAPGPLPQAPPPAPEPQTVTPPSRPAPPPLRFDDDDGPVIKIIAEDEAEKTPAETRSAANAQSFPGFTGLDDDSMALPAAALGRRDVSLDDLPGFDTAHASDDISDKAPAEDESIPSLDSFETPPAPELTPFPDAHEADKNEDSELPSFDMFAKSVPEQPEPETMPPQQPEGPETVSGFSVESCGPARKVSDTAVELAVTLKNAQTGQKAAITVTVSFDDGAVS